MMPTTMSAAPTLRFRSANAAAEASSSAPSTERTSARLPPAMIPCTRVRGVPKVHDTWQEVVRDPDVQILDIAVPPDQQLAIVRAAGVETPLWLTFLGTAVYCALMLTLVRRALG